MKNQIKNFLEILKLELEDLKDDLHILKKAVSYTHLTLPTILRV